MGAHQASDDLDGTLVASVAPGTHQHCQEECHEQVLLYECLVLFQDDGGAGLQHKQPQQPPPRGRSFNMSGFSDENIYSMYL